MAVEKMRPPSDPVASPGQEAVDCYTKLASAPTRLLSCLAKGGNSYRRKLRNGSCWTVIAVIVVAQILQAVAAWAAKAAIEQKIKSHFDRDIEGLKALLQTKSAHEKELIMIRAKILAEKLAVTRRNHPTKPVN